MAKNVLGIVHYGEGHNNVVNLSEKDTEALLDAIDYEALYASLESEEAIGFIELVREHVKFHCFSERYDETHNESDVDKG